MNKDFALVQYCSDLHRDFGPEKVKMPLLAEGVDVAVCAGDIARYDVRWIEDMAEAWRDADEILYVLGNHEFYYGEYNAIRRKAAEDCEGLGVRLLDGGTFVYQDAVHFIGATLWTDFRLYGNEGPAMLTAKMGINDFRVINGLTPKLSQESHFYERTTIERELAWAEMKNRNAVVITHHAPSGKCVHPKYRNDLLNPCFASDMDDVLLLNKISAWIHGHMHDSVSTEVHGVPIRANPHGYVTDRFGGNMQYKEQALIKVPYGMGLPAEDVGQEEAA